MEHAQEEGGGGVGEAEGYPGHSQQLLKMKNTEMECFENKICSFVFQSSQLPC